jgi:probable FeS assembly SUF system protein SufT
MNTTDNTRLLTRDCSSTVIPAGDVIHLPGGTRVTITHRLGGNFTVVCEYGMFRIAGKDADALGEEIPAAAALPPEATAVQSGPPEEETLWAVLKTVFDPEIPVNIVDLGLIYSLTITELSPAQYGVDVAMTLTAPGCGMGPTIAADAADRLKSVHGVASANVEIVWDPPWNQEMISLDGKMQLGLI